MKAFDNFRIYDWEEIAEGFADSDLFLGNGFSMSISSRFNYRSLFNRFLSYCTTREQSIFRTLNTTNFEAMQEHLQLTIDTNAIFRIDSRRIRRISRKLRQGLIESVTEVHPSYNALSPMRLGRICRELDQFDNIFTTNYDNFLYHIILNTNERCRERTIPKFQDFFRRRDDYLRFVLESNDIYRDVYYLHGALFLFKDPETPLGVVKLEKKPNVDLLDVIKSEIVKSNIPIFVSEGSSARKLQTIEGNPYLQFCKRKFENNKNNIVFYGFSFSRYDEHWINILNKTPAGRQLAIGVHLLGKERQQVIELLREILSKLSSYRSRNIRFFDSGTLFR